VGPGVNVRNRVLRVLACLLVASGVVAVLWELGMGPGGKGGTGGRVHAPLRVSLRNGARAESPKMPAAPLAEQDTREEPRGRIVVAGAQARWEATIRVHVVDDETGQPLAGIPVLPIGAEGSREARRHAFEAFEELGWGAIDERGDEMGFASRMDQPRSDGRGLVLMPAVPGVRYRIAVSPMASSIDAAELAIGPLEPGEVRDVRMPVHTRRTGVFCAVVVDASTGRRVVDVVARCLGGYERGGQGCRGEEGLLRLPYRGWVAYYAIEAPGYGPAVVVVDRERASEEDALVVRLDVAGTIIASVEAQGRRIRGASVRLSCSALELAELRQDWDFPLGSGVEPRYVVVESIDGEGVLTVTGLPTGVALTVEMKYKGAWRSLESGILLEPGEVLRREWELAVPRTIRGRVVGPGRRPVPGAVVVGSEILGLPPSRLRDGSWLVWEGRSHSRAGLMTAMTDGDGLFVLEDVVPGWWFLFASTENSGHLPQRASVGKVVRVLPAGDVVDVELELGDYFIRGEVADSMELRGTSIQVFAAPVGGYGALMAAARVGERFRVGPLPLTDVRVYAQTVADGPDGPRLLATPQVLVTAEELEAEGAEVHLRFHGAGRVSCITQGPPEVQGAVGRILAVPAKGVPQTYQCVGGSRTDLVGLPPGDYTVIVAFDKGWVGMATGHIEADADAGVWVIPVARGGVVQFSVSPDWEAGTVSVSVLGNNRRVWSGILRPGRPVTAVLPPGAYRVRATGAGGAEEWD